MLNEAGFRLASRFPGSRPITRLKWSAGLRSTVRVPLTRVDYKGGTT